MFRKSNDIKPHSISVNKIYGDGAWPAVMKQYGLEKKKLKFIQNI